MALVLLTILSELKDEDLALTDNLPLSELIPAIVARCVPDADRRATAKWVVGIPGRPALPMTQTLVDCGIRDGATLYLRDTTSPVPPPPPDPVPSPPIQPNPTVPRLDVNKVLVAQTPPSTHRLPTWMSIFFGFWCVALDAVIIRLTGTWILSTIGAVILLGVIGLFSLPEGPVTRRPAKAVPPEEIYPTDPLHQSLSHTPQSSTVMPMVDTPSTETINTLVESFLYDLGRMMTGQSVQMTYCAPAAVQYLDQLLAPVRERNEWISPQFGGTVDVVITHPPQRQGDPTVASVTLNDLSVRHLANREVIAPPQRTVVFSLVIDEYQQVLLDLRITSSAGTWP